MQISIFCNTTDCKQCRLVDFLVHGLQLGINAFDMPNYSAIIYDFIPNFNLFLNIL